jgi:hypothetical protein
MLLINCALFATIFAANVKYTLQNSKEKLQKVLFMRHFNLCKQSVVVKNSINEKAHTRCVLCLLSVVTSVGI